MEQDIFGLDVAVDYPVPVGVVERGRHFGGNPDGVGHRELFLPGEPVAHRFPLHVWHDIEEKAVGLPAVEEREDVGMLEVGGGLDLAQEPLGADDRGQLGPQHLDRDLAVVPEVLGEIDGGHPPLPDLFEESVAAGQGFRETGQGVGHDGWEDGPVRRGAPDQLAQIILRDRGGRAVSGRRPRFPAAGSSAPAGSG